jgi:SAM-dependent methyltransferase
MTPLAFDILAAVYDAATDWERRLAREGPFFRRLFEAIGVRRVLDAACGSGRHALLFGQWGLAVEAADISPGMLELARRLAGDTPGVRCIQRGFAEPVRSGPFDAVVCLGNSLPLAGTSDAVARALACMLAALRPGGVLVAHMPNLWKLPDGPVTWQRCARVELPDGPVLVVKGMHRCGARGYVDVVHADPTTGALHHAQSLELAGLEAPWLEQTVRAAGAGRVEFLGGYGGQSYDRATSEDLIMLAYR